MNAFFDIFGSGLSSKRRDFEGAFFAGEDGFAQGFRKCIVLENGGGGEVLHDALEVFDRRGEREGVDFGHLRDVGKNERGGGGVQLVVYRVELFL